MKRKSNAYVDLIANGEKCLTGLEKEGDAAGVVATTALVMSGALAAASKAQSEYRNAILANQAVAHAQDVQSDKAGVFISLVREHLKPIYGPRFNEAWTTVGFFGNSLMVPLRADLRSSVLTTMEVFFETHPELEIAGVMTKELVAALQVDLTAAMAAVRTAQVERRQKKTVRNAAVKALRQRIRALRHELEPLLAPNDPRWIDFGFGVPTDVHVTTAPEQLKLTLDAAAHVVASWVRPVNSDRFRVYKRVAGIDTDYVPVDTTTETSFDLGTFASGAHLDVQVTAINAAGESVPSQMVEIVVP